MAENRGVKLSAWTLALVAVGGCQSRLPGDVDTIRRPITVKYSDSEVSFKASDGLEMHGTLTVPAGSLARSYPCVLLLPGSGPTDRNGNQPNLTPRTLKQIAIGLAGAGIASYRFDKRACSVYSGAWPKEPAALAAYFSWANHKRDALAAWKRMKSHGLVDPTKTAIFGHSEGGVLALAIAAEAKPNAIVLAGTPGRPLAEVVHQQLSEKGASPAIVAESDAICAQLRASGQFPKKISPELRPLYGPSTRVFLRQLLGVDAAKLAAVQRAPILILNGEADNQVAAETDAQRLFASVKGRRDCDLEILPLASHNLKPVNSRSDLGLVGPVVPDAIEAIHRFLVPKIGGEMPDGQVEVDVN